MVAISGYENKIPDPRAGCQVIQPTVSGVISRKDMKKGERQHVPHASIILIECLRCNLSFMRVGHGRSLHAQSMKVDRQSVQAICTRSEAAPDIDPTILIR